MLSGAFDGALRYTFRQSVPAPRIGIACVNDASSEEFYPLGAVRDDNTHDVLTLMGLQNVRLLKLSELENY
jgi:hypothetical protein